jgi:hypothetical protein
MKDLDYYSVMKERINFLSNKYDPYHRFSAGWEQQRDEVNEVFPVPEVVHKRKIVNQISRVVNSISAFLF